MNTIKEFPYHDEGQKEADLLHFWFAVVVGVLVGPLVLFLAWLLKRKRLGWRVYTGLLAVSLFWLALFVPQVQAGGFGLPASVSGSVGQTLLFIWFLSIPLTPAVAVGLHTWEGIVNLIRPRSLDEHLQEQARILESKERKLSRIAGEQARRDHQAKDGLLSLGVFIKGERFPDWLGIKRERNNWLVLEDRVLAQHMLVLGTTGAGKSVTLTRIISEVLRATERDIFIIDGKGELAFAQDLANRMYAAGRGAIPIFQLGQGETGALYHGFRGQPVDIYNRLCALVGVEEATGDAQYYADINRDLLQLICYAPEGPPRSFEQVRQRVSKGWLLQAYRRNPQEQETIEGMDNRSLSGLLVRLRPLVREFAPLVGEDGFILEESRGAIFSLRTQSVGDTARRFLNFLVEDIKDFVGKRQKRPGLLVIDEFGAFNNATIVDLLMLARSADLGVILATQDVASLGEERTKQLILANTRTKLLMASDFPEEIAQLAGTIYQIEASIQHSEGDPTGVGSARVQHAFRVDMNESARLQPGEAFLIRQRHAAKLKVKQAEEVEHDPQAVVQVARPEAEVERKPVDVPGLDDDSDDVPELEL